MTDATLSEADYRDVVGRFASGVTVVTASMGGSDFGATASAVASLSVDPPMLVVCLNRASATANAAQSAGAFAVNILGEDQADMAVRFAHRQPDKFASLSVGRARNGAPLLLDALATMECRIVDKVEGGTHWVFLAAVDHAVAQPGSPLAYFRGQFGRLQLGGDDSAYAHLRSRILKREVAVGVPLDLADLAETLAATRGSVYHALSRMAAEGLVARTPEGAFTVRPLTAAAARDAAQARFAIMLGVAQLTVGGVTAEQRAEMRRLVAATAPPSDGPIQVDAWADATKAFLDYVVDLSGSATLLDSFRRASVATLIMQLAPGEDPLDVEGTHDAHVALVEAYEHADTAAAVAALRRILDGVLAMIEVMFAEHAQI